MWEDGRSAACSKPENMIVHPNVFIVLRLKLKKVITQKEAVTDKSHLYYDFTDCIKQWKQMNINYGVTSETSNICKYS